MDVVLKPERTIKCRACGHEAKGASEYVWHYCTAFYERDSQKGNPEDHER